VRTLIGVSPRVSEEVRHFFPGTHVETIPNGVDPATFSPDPSERLRRRAELGIGESELVALFVGGDWERKGLSAAVDALAFAPRWRLLVVGDGDQASAAARARRTGVGDRLHFFRPTPAVDGFYKLADAFVLPTRYETFSLVTYEAAACGLPLLATLVGGIEDILRDGETGFAIDGDPRAIGARLEQLASSPTLREALGNAAHARARDYSWDRIVARYRVLYDRLSAA
jgi:UDP-glucose:(heptosyl)LPS alpha-1,3-glucosyltransferase